MLCDLKNMLKILLIKSFYISQFFSILNILNILNIFSYLVCEDAQLRLLLSLFLHTVMNYGNHAIKGYLRYKTTISQNVLSEAQIKNFFIS